MYLVKLSLTFTHTYILIVIGNSVKSLLCLHVFSQVITDIYSYTYYTLIKLKGPHGLIYTCSHKGHICPYLDIVEIIKCDHDEILVSKIWTKTMLVLY